MQKIALYAFSIKLKETSKLTLPNSKPGQNLSRFSLVFAISFD